MSKFGKIAVFGIIVVVFAIVGFYIRFLSPEEIPQPSGHTWNIYENEKTGFAIAYPSDICEPHEARDPENPDIGFPGADTVQFLDSEFHKVIFIWVQQTEAKSIDEWFKLVYGEDGNGYIISETTAIAGQKAIGIKEEYSGKAPGSYNLHFIKGQNQYSLYIHDDVLSPEDVVYIKNSFRFIK